MSSAFSYVGKAFTTINDFYRDINPSTLSGAIDIVVVEDEEGTLACSPFHIRFGKLKLLMPSEKIIEISVNGVKLDIQMKLGDAGEAFFVVETTTLCISPPVYYPMSDSEMEVVIEQAYPLSDSECLSELPKKLVPRKSRPELNYVKSVRLTSDQLVRLYYFESSLEIAQSEQRIELNHIHRIVAAARKGDVLVKDLSMEEARQGSDI